VNRLKAREAVRKYVHFLEPPIWQRQKSAKQQIPAQTTRAMNQSLVFSALASCLNFKSDLHINPCISREISLCRWAAPLLPGPRSQRSRMEYVVYKINAVLRGIKSTGYVQQIAVVYRLSTARQRRFGITNRQEELSPTRSKLRATLFSGISRWFGIYVFRAACLVIVESSDTNIFSSPRGASTLILGQEDVKKSISLIFRGFLTSCKMYGDGSVIAVGHPGAIF
jgi:hypothetical protein